LAADTQHVRLQLVRQLLSEAKDTAKRR